ncbi:MAG: hypothetical protein RLZZ143_2377, partial [Cyanobacteriota bacterium]
PAYAIGLEEGAFLAIDDHGKLNGFYFGSPI